MIGPIKVSRSLKELATKIKEVQREYLCKKGKDISLLEISKILGISKEEIAMALEAERPLDSIDEEINENETKCKTKISRISNGKDETNELINKMCMQDLINTLEERDKKIIVLRYYKEKTQSEVAKLLGISQVQISRIEKKILLNMREKIAL